jgi:adenine-specific DNA-methyltransferase
MSKTGKLELTWVGKYDNKKIEPRLLIEDKVKSNTKHDEKTQNMLIHGDNLLALKALEPDYAGKIKCIYIDPPYNTGSAFETYDDNLEHSIWLSMMKPRLELLRRLLRQDGFIFVQIDDIEHAYLKVMMDEIFGRSNYITSFIWIGRAGQGGTAKYVANQHEYILCYSKSKESILNKESKETVGGNYRDDVGSYKREQLRQWGQADRRVDRPSMWYPIESPVGTPVYPIKDDHSEGRWRVSKATFLKLKNSNLIDFVEIEGGWKVYKKIRDGRITKSTYGTLLDNLGTSATGTSEIKKIFNAKTFDTPKPEKLLERIITMSTNEDDYVLDSFLGSGTTVAVAHKMNRRWIGIELGDHAYTHCKVRLDKVIEGEQGGVSKDLDWLGGGGYKFFELASSLLEKHESLPIYQLNKKYSFGMLCEAICKLEGFKYEPKGEMHGYSSETRFVHISSEMVTGEYIKHIYKNMNDNDSVLIYTNKVQSNLKLPDSIEVKRIPKDLLDKYDFESEVR